VFGEKETRDLLKEVNIVWRSTGSTNRLDQVEDILLSLSKKLPIIIPSEDVFKKYPTDYEESMNTVLY
jgi:dynein heavy chain